MSFGKPKLYLTTPLPFSLQRPGKSLSEHYVSKQNKKPVDKIIQLPLAKLMGMAEHCVCNVPGESLAHSALQAPHTRPEQPGEGSHRLSSMGESQVHSWVV